MKIKTKRIVICAIIIFPLILGIIGIHYASLDHYIKIKIGEKNYAVILFNRKGFPSHFLNEFCPTGLQVTNHNDVLELFSTHGSEAELYRYYDINTSSLSEEFWNVDGIDYEKKMTVFAENYNGDATYNYVVKVKNIFSDDFIMDDHYVFFPDIYDSYYLIKYVSFEISGITITYSDDSKEYLPLGS